MCCVYDFDLWWDFVVDCGFDLCEFVVVDEVGFVYDYEIGG